MSLPGFPSVTPFTLSQGEKGGVVLTYVSTWLCLSHSSSTWLCLSQSSHGKVRRGVVLTYVFSWLFLCHVIYLIAR